MIRKIRKIARRLGPRHPKAKARLKFSYRPRLRSILSADTAMRRREQGSGRHVGMGRKVLALLVIGSVGFILYQQGALERVRDIIGPYVREMKVGLQPAKHADKAVAKASLLLRARNFWESRFGGGEKEETPVAFVRLKEVYGLGASGAILTLRNEDFFDMPVVSGAFPENRLPGDTLKEAALALSLITEAGKSQPGLLKRISEIVVKNSGEARALFADSKVVAVLGPRNAAEELANLSVYLDRFGKGQKGTVNMMYGDIAFVTEEGQNE